MRIELANPWITPRAAWLSRMWYVQLKRCLQWVWRLSACQERKVTMPNADVKESETMKKRIQGHGEEISKRMHLFWIRNCVFVHKLSFANWEST